MDQTPSSIPESSQMPEHATRHHRTSVQNGQPRRGWAMAFFALLIIIVVGGGIFCYHWFVLGNKSYTKSENSETWQSVFLTNGQVYFGHLKERNSKYPLLTDIYYLQVNQDLQSGNENTNTTTNTNTNQPQISLIKLGDELHGPKDQMYIAKNQILFWEDLKDDSQVVTAIKNYKK